MLLLTGPAGSGKTFLVLEKLREALARNDARVRLLAPTATMARHVQNRIAREGFVPRPQPGADAIRDLSSRGPQTCRRSPMRTST